MNIGLTFLPQIQSGPLKFLGGWVTQSFQQMIVAVTKGYHTEHNEDDTHRTITASGSITERQRTSPMGAWINVPWGNIVFAASGSMTWTVSAGNLAGVGVSYQLVGTTMTLAWNMAGTSVAGTPSTLLYFTVDQIISPVNITCGTFHYNNNGTFGVGRCTVAPLSAGMQGLRIGLNLVNMGNWSASVQNTDAVGQFSFEVTGV